MLHQRVGEAVESLGLKAVELEDVAVLDVLVDAVQVVDGPGVLGGGVQHVDAEGEIGFLIAQHAEDGGQDVDVLGYLVLDAAHGLAGVEDDDGRAEAAEVGLVLGMVAHVGVVAGQHEDGVPVPRLARCGLEEAAYGHVGIAYALVHDDAFLGIALPVLVGYDVGVVAGGGEDGGHEGLLHLAHHLGIVLQEGLVPDGPRAVEVVGAVSLLVLGPAVVVLESGLAGKGLEAHGAVLRPVEEGGLVALLCQDARQSGVVVHGRGRQDEGLDEHGDAGQYAGHSVNGLAAVAEGVAEGGALADEVVDAGGVALVAASFQVFVQGSDVLAAETLDYHDDDVLFKGRVKSEE